MRNGRLSFPGLEEGHARRGTESSCVEVAVVESILLEVADTNRQADPNPCGSFTLNIEVQFTIGDKGSGCGVKSEVSSLAEFHSGLRQAFR